MTNPRNHGDKRQVTDRYPLTDALGVISYPRIFTLKMVCIGQLMQRKIEVA